MRLGEWMHTEHTAPGGRPSVQASASAVLPFTATVTLGAPEAWWLAGCVMLLGAALLIWSTWRSGLRAASRWVALLCKLLALALIAALLLEPLWVSEVPKRGANDLAILADNGASLGVQEKNATNPVGHQIKEVLQDTAWTRKLRETFRVQQYRFDEKLQELGRVENLDFKGSRSGLMMSLEAVRQRYEHRPLAGAIIFTDGNATDASRLTTLMEGKAPAPLYLVATGMEKPPADLSLSNLVVTQTPFEDSPVAVQATVQISGGISEPLALVLRDEEGKTVLTEKATPAAKATSHQFHVRFRPVKPGLLFYTATVLKAANLPLLENVSALAAAQQEASMENNQRVFAVDRKSGPYRVLYVSGRPNWDYKFLRRALEADDEIKLASLIRIAKREPKFEWRGRSGEQSNPLFRGFRPDVPEEAQRYDQPVLQRLGIADKSELANGFPSVPEDLFGAYRGIILDDVEAEFFTQAQLELLERYVSARGGSLLMLGGQESFAQGGYMNTPVARLLPVQLERPSGPVLDEVKFSLTREGWLEPWMRLRQEEPKEQSRLAAMPAFHAVNAVRTVKPGASVLATIQDIRSSQEYPAWVSHRFGSGRVGAVLVGDLWRWAMHSPESQADFAKSWRQLLRHLVVDVPDRVELRVAEDQHGNPERVRLQVRVRDRAFLPMDDATVALTLTAPGGKQMELPVSQSLQEAGLFESTASAAESGAYRVTARITDAEGEVIGEPVTGWAMNPLADELASMQVNRPLLERLAAWSGGRVLEMDDLPGLIDSLPREHAPLTESRVEPLWHTPWWWLMVVGLLSVEWWLRRRTA